MNKKIRLCFKDRVGIVADISRLIAKNGLNIVSMEVIREFDEAHVYTEIENSERSPGNDDVIGVLKNIAGVSEFAIIDTMPHEERANRFRVVLDNINDGVLSIDRQSRIVTINRVAADIWKCGLDIIGQNIHKLDMPEYAILKCLKGERINNLKNNLITKTGRYQYISTCKPIHDSSGNIIGAVEIAKDLRSIKKLALTISEPDQISFSDIIGQNSAIREAITFAQKIASTDASVSVRGDSGTGKELFARAIHTSSGRDGSFIPVNCAALPEQLLESELFGYVGGAFTGGIKEGKPGLFEMAHKGTIFLDEIADMPLGSQAKLLRLLQEKAVRRIGGSKEIPIDARIITATNKNLEKLVEEKTFRQDLYYRISVLPIHIPPLKQRLDDIALLAEHFLFQLSIKLGGLKQSLTPLSLNKLIKHDWPGNIRELKNVVERAAILCDNEIIDAADILFSYELNRTIGSGSVNIESPDQSGRSLKVRIADYEKKIVMEALENNKSIRKAALHLKISHPALIKKMRKYGIKRVVKTVTAEPR